MVLFKVVVITVVLQLFSSKWEFDFLLTFDAITYHLQFLLGDEIERMPSFSVLRIALILDFLLDHLLHFVVGLGATGSRGEYWRSFEIYRPYYTLNVVRSLRLL